MRKLLFLPIGLRGRLLARLDALLLAGGLHHFRNFGLLMMAWLLAVAALHSWTLPDGRAPYFKTVLLVGSFLVINWYGFQALKRTLHEIVAKFYYLDRDATLKKELEIKIEHWKQQ